MLITDRIFAKANIDILIRERGKLVGRRQLHNIFVNLGREWMANLVGGEVSTYVSQMGFGIGGFRQNNPLADQAPCSDYPVVGASSQYDTDATVTAIERPVRISGGTGWPPIGTDAWLKASAAPTHPTSTRTRFTVVVTSAEISYGTYATVPLSEIGLFLSDKVTTGQPNQTIVAYKCLDPIAKTTSVELEVRWTLVF